MQLVFDAISIPVKTLISLINLPSDINWIQLFFGNTSYNYHPDNSFIGFVGIIHSARLKFKNNFN